MTENAVRINDAPTPSKYKTLDVTYVDDNYVVSHGEVWAYFRIPGDPLNIPSLERMASLANSTQRALARFPNLQFHYYAATHAFDTTQWFRTVLQNQKEYEDGYGTESAPYFRTAIERQAEYMRRTRKKEHTIYLGVRIALRKAESDVTVHDGDSFFVKAKKTARRFYTRRLGGVNAKPSNAELARYTKRANEVRSALIRNKYLKAIPLTMEESYEMLFRAGAPGMPIEPHEAIDTEVRWGGESVLNVLDAGVDNSDPTMLKFTRRNPRFKIEWDQYKKDEAAYDADPLNTPIPVPPERTYNTYAITKAVEFPGFHKEDAADAAVYKAWALDSRSLENSPSVDISVRFRVDSHSDSKKKANKTKEKAATELSAQLDAGVHGGGNEDTKEKVARAAQHASEIATGNAPAQMTVSARMIIHSDDPEQLRADADFMREFYYETHNITLIEKDGQHYTFWEESLPGQLVRPTFRVHDADIDVFTNGLPFTTEHIGYPHDGFFFGSAGSKPLLFDPTRAARNGMAPAIVSNGKLGGGKSVFTLMMIDIFRLMGCYGMIIDPKKDMRALLAFLGRGHARLWSLTDDGRPGELDPFFIFSVEVNPKNPEIDTYEKAYAKWREETATVVNDNLQRALTGRAMSADHEALLSELVKRLMDEGNPSMHKLLQYLNAGELGRADLAEKIGMTKQDVTSERRKVTQIGAWLTEVASTTLGKLVFGERTGEFSLLIEGVKTTIVDVSGLELPKGEGAIPTTPNEIISVALFSLVTAFARRALESPNIKGAKYLAVDEFSQIRDSPAMQALTSRFNRMGRSLNIIPMYIDQSTASSVGNEAFNNSTGARFVFRSDYAEAMKVADSLSLKGEEADALASWVPQGSATPGVAFCITPPDNHPLSQEVSREQSLGQVRMDYGWYDPIEQEYFETNDNPIGKPDNWVRAAYRHYDLDDMGILHDPLSPSLIRNEAVEVDMSQPVAPVSEPTSERELVSASNVSDTENYW